MCNQNFNPLDDKLLHRNEDLDALRKDRVAPTKQRSDTSEAELRKRALAAELQRHYR